MASNNNNDMLNDKFKENEPTRKSESLLEIENAYLTQQNEHLSRELSFARYTITAMKNITYQKETDLEESRQELERALQHIQLLTLRLKSQQRDMERLVLAGMGPTLIQDDLSDDQELSEEEYEQQQQQQQQQERMQQKQQVQYKQLQQPQQHHDHNQHQYQQQQHHHQHQDIMSKLPLRHPINVMQQSDPIVMIDYSC